MIHPDKFADYDCSKCRNCCKMYKGSIPLEDAEREAEYLEITPEQPETVQLVKCIGYHRSMSGGF